MWEWARRSVKRIELVNSEHQDELDALDAIERVESRMDEVWETFRPMLDRRLAGWCREHPSRPLTLCTIDLLNEHLQQWAEDLGFEPFMLVQLHDPAAFRDELLAEVRERRWEKN